MSWRIQVIELDRETLPRKWKEKISVNDHGVHSASLIEIKYLSDQMKIKAVRDGDFVAFRRYPTKVGKCLVREIDKTYRQRIEVLRECHALKKELMQSGMTVWFDEPSKYSVYVIRLKPEVNKGKFKKRNGGKQAYPGYFYVGQTALSVEQRYQRHLQKGPDGNKVRIANSYVHEHADGIAWEQMSTPEGTLTELESLEEEARLARYLQSKGYAVWFH